MANDYDTLGIAKTATVGEAKKAYRKLRGQYHPDHNKEPGAAVKFQEIQAAWERIQKGQAKVEPEFRQYKWRQGSPNPTYDDLYKHFFRDQTFRDTDSEYWKYVDEMDGYTWHDKDHRTDAETVVVSLRDAFKGFVYTTTVNGKTGKVAVPPGYPNDSVAECQFLSTGSSLSEIIRVRLKVQAPDGFQVKGFEAPNDKFGSLFTAAMNTGDMEHIVEVSALDIIAGAWITIQDFLGESLMVKVPAGFSTNAHLKVKGKGYQAWTREYNCPEDHRADLYIKIKPVIPNMKDIDLAKLEALVANVKLIQGGSTL